MHCPLAPALLSQYWVRNAYSDICNRRSWAWLRSESEFLINTAKSGTVNVTRGSASVSGGTLVYAASDVDRQFRVGTNEPVYTIIAASALSYTLDRVYGGVTAVGTGAQVGDFYLTCPADFQRFLAVLDPANNWQLHLWVTEEELNTWDAQRSSTGTPWAVASRRLKTQGTASLIGRAQYELWPYAIEQKNYPFFYYRQPELLADSTEFLGVLARRGELVTGLALAEAAAWPGLEDRRNPYFNLNLAQMKRKEINDELNRLEVLDEEVYMTWLETVSWINRYEFAPIDSRYMQSHDTNYSGFSGW